jgi:serine/threonine-protein kinase
MMNCVIGSVLGTRFRVDGLLGEGGMGKVFRARDLVLEREVAIKVLRLEHAADERFVTRFFHEAQVVAQLSANPHVIQIYDVGRSEDGALFLVMECLHGRTLRSVMGDRWQASRSWVLEIGQQVASALHDAHAHGIVHRDVKPENVFVMTTPTISCLVKVLDFGLSRADHLQMPDEHASLSGLIAGTPRHVAPEVVSGHEAQAASDIYSLGLTLYEFASGTFPYGIRTSAECLRAHLMAQPAPFPDEPVPFFEEFQTLVFEMLEKEPSRRPTAEVCRRTMSRLYATNYGNPG